MLAIVLLAWWTPSISAQPQKGTLFGTVSTLDGEAVPGATVTLTGPGFQRTTISNERGQVRFLGLPPGRYQMTAQLEGFRTIRYPSIQINSGRTTAIDVKLAIGGLEETITVTMEGALLAETITSGTTVTQIEREKTPSARDPWAIPQLVPGVLRDRIDVGGNETGRQSSFLLPGSSLGQNRYLIDGVTITDRDNIGATPPYFNLEIIEEVSVQTGGLSTEVDSVRGALVHVITKSGGNDSSGSINYLFTDDTFSSGITPTEPTVYSFGREITRIREPGITLGGPIVKDKLWFFGAYSRLDIESSIRALGEVVSDDTLIENYTVKVTVNPTPSNRATLFYTRSDWTTAGMGAGPTRPLSTTWNRTGPLDIVKIEDSHVVGSTFFFHGQYSEVKSGFQLTPQGGITGPSSLFDAEGSWQRNFFGETNDLDIREAKVGGALFFNTGGTSHELTFGVGSSQHDFQASYRWPQNQIQLLDSLGETYVYPGDTATNTSIKNRWAWVQEAFTVGDVTVTAGFRYELQTAMLGRSTITGNPYDLTLLPDVTFSGGDLPFEWETIAPRIGVTYALGDERKTLLRASYARYPQQLDTFAFRLADPAHQHFNTFDGAFARRGIDVNGNGLLDFDEPAGETIILGGVPVDDPGFLKFDDVIDPNYDATMFNEVVLSVEHAFLPEFVIGASATWSTATGLAEFPLLVSDPSGNPRPATSGDFVPGAGVDGMLPDGTSYSEPTFRLDPGLSYTGGNVLTNGARKHEYLGIGINFTKRLSRRWMLRGHYTYYDWEWNVPNTFSLGDPNNIVARGLNGEVVAERSFLPDKPGVYLHSRWSYNVNGLYQLAPDRPWGFTVAGNVFGRDGYPLPYFARTTSEDGRTRDIQVGSVGDVRADDILTVDLRLEKEFNALGDVSFTVGFDAFNVLNEDVVLQRERQLGLPTTGFTEETLSPRVFRLGARLHWR